MLAALGVSVAGGSGCQEAAPWAPGVQSGAFAIIGGLRATSDLDATVLLLNLDAGFSACSGSVIAPRVVVTAKHCLGPDPSDPDAPLGVRVLARPTMNQDDQYDVVAGRTTEGRAIDGIDFAMLVVDRDIDLYGSPAYELSRDQSELREGDEVTLAGYGQSSAEGGGGFEKLQTVDQVVDLTSDIVYTDGRGACSGDSGGTVLDPEGRLAGVMVRADCAGLTISQRIDPFLDLVDWALEESGICVPDPETCNGIDDDCDGFVDPGCTAEGDTCLEDRSCAPGLACLEDAGEPVCAQPCVPAGAGVCGASRYCDALGPDAGRCRDGQPGAAPEGAPCSADTDCRSLACAVGTCRIQCAPNVVACPFGLHCTDDPALPGICARPGDAPDGPLVLGDPCRDDDAGRCEPGLSCVGTDRDRYCAPSCAEGCPVGFHCREDACVRGEIGDAGSSCIDDLDCAEGTRCVAAEGMPQLAGARVCAPPCGSGCADGLSCVDGVCLPELAVVGAPCRDNDDCVSGLCGHFDDGNLCTERCGGLSACPMETVCILLEDGLNLLCLKPPAEEPSGGCAVAPGRTRAGSAAVLGLLAALLRRRRGARGG